jgi:hypothetical protein
MLKFQANFGDASTSFVEAFFVRRVAVNGSRRVTRPNNKG